MNVKELKTRSKVLIISGGVLTMAGLGVGAANATTSPPVTTRSGTADTPTPGDVADAPGASESPETADAPEPPGDTGPGVEQTGDHTDPGDAPDAL